MSQSHEFDPWEFSVTTFMSTDGPSIQVTDLTTHHYMTLTVADLRKAVNAFGEAPWWQQGKVS